MEREPDPIEEDFGEEWTPPLAPAVRGRGAAENPANRFERLHVEPDPEHEAEREAGREGERGEGPGTGRGLRTVYLRDASRSVLSRNDSPDVGYRVGVNPYRGCEHGCIYCYARPYHEYLGFSSGLDFESRILVKAEAPALLRRTLLDPRYEPEPINLCGVTDPYQPVEKTLGLTRGCLEVLAEFRNPVSVVTKNRLVVRDADLLGDLARLGAAVACVSVTTLDPQVTATLEPRATRPAGRLEAVRALAGAGVPVGVLVSPVIPGLTDHEIPSILDAAAAAGARHAAYTVLRLPHAVKDLFSAWLERHHPDRASKVLNRLRAMRGGELDDPRFGRRMRGEGTWAEQIAAFFASARRRAGLDGEWPDLETRHFRRPASGQLRLFE